MADQITESKTVGFGSRLVGSIQGVFVGFLLFVASFCVLYWNEGRTDISNIAKNAREILSNRPAPDDAIGTLVSTSGMLKTDELLGDNLYLNPGPYLSLSRDVQMYAWIEESRSETKKNVGGSETTTTTYTYKKDWTSNPRNASSFKEPAGHDNPPMGLNNLSLTPQKATIGILEVTLQGLALPSSSDLNLTPELVMLSNGAVLAGGRYVFVPKNPPPPPPALTATSETTPAAPQTMPQTMPETAVTQPVIPPQPMTSLGNPEVGDMRISYSALSSEIQGTLLGLLSGNTLQPFMDPKGHRLFRFFTGTKETAVAQLHSEHTMMTWILRGVGFLMMWFGLSGLFGPVSTFLDIVPALGSLSRSIIGFITLGVSSILTAVTIVVSMIAHSLIALLVSVAVTLLLMILIAKILRKKRAVA